MKTQILLSFACLFLWFSAPAQALLSPEESLENPAWELRARELEKRLRCQSCEGQSIADSESFLALDMRLALRRLIAQGKTDRQALEWFYVRYGKGIDFRPPFDRQTWGLWFLPGAVFLAGLLLLFWSRKGRQP